MALIALAAALRFHALGVTPPGFQFDEAYNALDTAALLDGQRPLFLPRNGGREVLYTYLQAGLASLFGLSVRTLRLTSALAGIATVGATYVLLRRILRVDSRRLAALTASVLAISFWHLHFSHYGIRVILMPLIYCGLFGFFWLGCRTRRAWPFLAAGALAGLSVWTNPTGRLTPFVLAAYVAWLAWTRRGDGARKQALDGTGIQGKGTGKQGGIGLLAGLLLTGAAAFLVFLPLGLEFVRHPDFFLGHAGAVSVFSERVGGGSPLGALARHAAAVLGMFSVVGDRVWIHNLAGRPVFDLLLSVPFWLGVVLYTRRLFRRTDPDRDALVLLALWAGVMLLPTMLSDDAPNFSRALPALPALFVPAALGLAALADFIAARFHDRRTGQWVGGAVVGVILLISGIWACRDYFIRFPAQPEVYYAYDVDKLDAWARLAPHIGQDAVYLSQLWAEHSTLEFLRRGTDVRSLDSSNTLVLPPPGQGAVYAFPGQQQRRAAQVAGLWPGRAVLEPLTDRYGKPLLWLVTVDAAAAAGWPAGSEPEVSREISFDDAPTLLGLRQDGGSLLMAWRAETPMARTLTAFVHLFDADGRKVGQADQLPGDGSYLTPAWQPGERVIERYSPVLEPCRDERPLRVMAGWYETAAGGARRPRRDGQGDLADAGTVTIPLRSLPADQVALPQTTSGPIVGRVALIGYRMDSVGAQPGAPLTLDLYWRCDGEGSCPAEAAGQPASVTLEPRDGGPGAPLWQGAVAPETADWRAGEVLCRRLALRVPPDAAPGNYRLVATLALSSAMPAPLADVAVGPSTRRYDAPPVTERVDAQLGDAIRLLGATTAPDGITLVWQAIRAPETAYTVFVHVLDQAGQIVAQSDASPAALDVPGGYPTDRWAAGEVVVDRHALAIPEGASGALRVVAGMYDPLTGARLPATDATGRALPDGAVPIAEMPAN